MQNKIGGNKMSKIEISGNEVKIDGVKCVPLNSVQVNKELVEEYLSGIKEHEYLNIIANTIKVRLEEYQWTDIDDFFEGRVNSDVKQLLQVYLAVLD
jgi:hypothetical protein